MFISCILAGFFAGFFYDVNRALRNGFRLKKLVPFVDLLFWAVITAFTYAVLYRSGNGQLRGFCLGGIGGGVVLYVLCFSPVLGRWMVVSARGVNRCIKGVTTPVKACFSAGKSKIIRFVQNKQKNRKIFVKKTLEKSEKIV